MHTHCAPPYPLCLHYFTLCTLSPSASPRSPDGAFIGAGCVTGETAVWTLPAPKHGSRKEGSKTVVPPFTSLTRVNSAAPHDMPVTAVTFVPMSYSLAPSGSAARSNKVDPSLRGMRLLLAGSADYRCSVLPVAKRNTALLLFCLIMAALLVGALVGAQLGYVQLPDIISL